MTRPAVLVAHQQIRSRLLEYVGGRAHPAWYEHHVDVSAGDEESVDHIRTRRIECGTSPHRKDDLVRREGEDPTDDVHFVRAVRKPVDSRTVEWRRFGDLRGIDGLDVIFRHDAFGERRRADDP